MGEAGIKLKKVTPIGENSGLGVMDSFGKTQNE
jgi:hypothetical protein